MLSFLEAARPHRDALAQRGVRYSAQVPEGIDWMAVNTHCMERYSVEIAGGLGPSAGKVWRVGVMVRICLFLFFIVARRNAVM